MHMVEKILNNTTPYRKIRASHEGSLHSSTLRSKIQDNIWKTESHSGLTLISKWIESLNVSHQYGYSICGLERYISRTIVYQLEMFF